MRNVLYAKKDLKIGSLADLSGVTVAVGRANAVDIVLSRDAPGDTKIQRYDDEAGAYQAILSGQADAVGFSEVAVPQLEKRDPRLADLFEIKLTLTDQAHGVAFRKEDTELLNLVNNWLNQPATQTKLNEIHMKWLGRPYGNYQVKQ